MKLLDRLKNFFSGLEEIFVFDIETVPDEDLVKQFYTKEELENRTDSFSFPTSYQKIIAFSYAKWKKKADEPYENESYTVGYNIENELQLLNRISELICQLPQTTKFITFNGAGFDIPVIEKRCLIHLLREDDISYTKNLSSLYLLMQDLYDDRFSNRHLDLFYLLNMKFQKGGLRLLLKQCGLNKHEGITGADVSSLVEAKDYKTLYEYSKYDAYVEGKLFVEFIRKLKGKNNDKTRTTNKS
jgi:predicted PolB exonuclease-like 3'-5' exonuclease